MTARHFCFCLPLRLGAFLISFCQLILVGLLAAAGWYALESMRGRLPTHLRGSIAASSIYYTILSITALIGLFGTISRNASLLSTYAFYLAWSTGLQVVLDVLQLILFFRESRQTLIQNCIDGSADVEVQNICNNSFNSSKWSIVVSMVVGLIIQFWAAYIVASYAKKLEIEKSWRSGPGATTLHDTSTSKYTHVQQQDDHGANVPLANASHAYPYSGADNSFGGSTPYRYIATSV